MTCIGFPSKGALDSVRFPATRGGGLVAGHPDTRGMRNSRQAMEIIVFITAILEAAINPV